MEHKGSESLLIFRDVNRISQSIIDSLLIESYEKEQQKDGIRLLYHIQKRIC